MPIWNQNHAKVDVLLFGSYYYFREKIAVCYGKNPIGDQFQVPEILLTDNEPRTMQDKPTIRIQNNLFSNSK